MTRENARIKVEQLDYYLSHTCQDYGERDHEAMMMAIEVLEQESTTMNDLTDDCISREDVLQTLLDYDYANENALVIQDIKALPSVKPKIEPRKGHWIDTKEISTNRRGQIVHEVICSECSGIAYFRSMGNKYIGANYCPNCRAYMRNNTKHKGKPIKGNNESYNCENWIP